MAANTKNKSQKKPGSRSFFYRISAWLHLWLGLISGIIVVIICITGCIWVFNEEITGILQPETRVAPQDKEILKPSQIMAVAEKEYPGKRAGYAIYKQGKAIEVSMAGRRGGSTLNINPYSGEVISKIERKEGETNFFRWILNGHRFLWMPYQIGRPIVNYSTLICVITLISGLVLWWPKKWNKNTREQSFKIKWGASFKRVNYDLHNVFGFYSLLLLLMIALTGMVWGIEWYSKGLYWVTSGGKPLPEFVELKSDSLQANKHYTPAQAADLAWNKVVTKHASAKGFYIAFPDTARPRAIINIIVYPSKGQYYNNQRYAFDQHTLAELKGNKLYEESYAEASFGTKLRRMNYDIHVGSILGLPGKFLAFFASLIGATLPVTGFLVWWGKRKKKKKPAKAAITPKAKSEMAAVAVH